MIHWTAEADNQEPGSATANADAAQANTIARQQREDDALYGLHNYVVLDSLLKRCLHRDKGFDS